MNSRRDRRDRRAIGLLAIVALWLVALVGAPGVAAADASAPPAAEATAPPAGPPYPDPVDGRPVYDFGGLFSPEAIEQAEFVIDAIEGQTKAEVVVYTQALGTDDFDETTAEQHAAALMDQWGVGRRGINDGLVILADLDTSLQHGQVRLFGGSGFLERYLDVDGLQALADETMLPLMAAGEFDAGLLSTLSRVVEATIGAETKPDDPGAPAEEPFIQPGPPYPDPEVDRAVYDFAGVLTPETIADAEATIDKIEARTGAEVVVYTEPADYGVSTEETEARARALIDQWGVGRAGFDDGLAIFFDIDPSKEHGQVQLYAAPRFRGDLPLERRPPGHLRERHGPAPARRRLRWRAERGAGQGRCRGDAGERGAPADRAPAQRRAGPRRSADRVPRSRRLGVHVVAPVRQGPGLSRRPVDPHAGTAARPDRGIRGVRDGRRHVPSGADDRDARSRVPRPDLVPGGQGPVGPVGQGRGGRRSADRRRHVEEARRARNGRRPIGPAEAVALRELRQLAMGEDEGFIKADDLPKFGTSVGDFDTALEKHVVDRGWFSERPSKVTARWTGKGVLAIVAGGVALLIGLQRARSRGSC